MTCVRLCNAPSAPGRRQLRPRVTTPERAGACLRVCVALGDRPEIRHPPSGVVRSGFIFAPIRGERLALRVASERARYGHAGRSRTGDANNDDAADKHKRASRRLLEWHGRALPIGKGAAIGGELPSTAASSLFFAPFTSLRARLDITPAGPRCLSPVPASVPAASIE